MKPRSTSTFVFSRPMLRRIGRASHRDQQLLGFDVLHLAVRKRDLHLHARAGLLHVVALCAGLDANLALLEDPFEFLRNLFVLHRNDARQHLENADLRPEALEHRRKLDAHRARADNHQRFRHLRQVQNFDIGQDEFRIGLQTGQHPRFRTGRDQDVFRLEHLRAFVALDFDLQPPGPAFDRAVSLESTRPCSSSSETRRLWRVSERCRSSARSLSGNSERASQS